MSFLENIFSFFTQNNECLMQNKLNFYLPILFFIIGYCISKFFIFKTETNSKEEARKIKITEYILNKYQKENEDFFLGKS